jgi:hypothetical protein
VQINSKVTIVVFATFLLVSCAVIPSKVVTLVSNAGDQFAGKLEYSDGLSGTLVVTEGPDNESFAGPYSVVDRTAVHNSQGTVVVQKSNMPTVGAASTSSSSQINATGYWYGRGNRGSTMNCTLEIGRQGHGHGICQHSNGQQYQIVL